MSDKSAISWTDVTWNPLLGCSRVSAGCGRCYAINHVHRMAGNPNPKVRSANEGLTTRHRNGQLDWTGAVRTLPSRLEQPLHWRAPRRVFVNSLSDLFHPEVPFTFVAAMFGVMAACPRHTFQVLTKRPERMRALFAWLEERAEQAREVFPHESPAWRRAHCLRSAALNNGADLGTTAAWLASEGWPLPNVWLGTSVEHQAAADERIPQLLATPAAVRFLSAEPLLGPVDLGRYMVRCPSCGATHLGPCDVPRPWPLHWVITGGESGPGYRPADPAWFGSVRDQCVAAGVPFFFKQGAGARPGMHRELDGRIWEEYPA